MEWKARRLLIKCMRIFFVRCDFGEEDSTSCGIAAAMLRTRRRGAVRRLSIAPRKAKCLERKRTDHIWTLSLYPHFDEPIYFPL